MPQPGETQTIGGQLRNWAPTTHAQDAFAYLGTNSGFQSAEDAQMADLQSGEGSWVPASDKNPNGTLFGPSWMLPAMLAGPATASGIGAMFGAGGAGAGAGAATPAALQTAAAVPGAAGSVGAVAPALGGITGGATVAPSAAGALGGGGSAGLFSSILSGAQKVAPLLSGAGQAIGGATKAAANNRGEENNFNQENARLQAIDNQTGVSAFNANTSAQSAFDQMLMNRAIQEGAQRKNAYGDVYKESVAENPSQSPYNPKGVPGLSSRLMETLHSLATQGQGMLSKPLTNNVADMPKPTYQPFVPKPLTLPTWTKPGTAEEVGNWLGPILTGTGAVLGARR